MQLSDDFTQLKAWMPLVMENRNNQAPVAATYVDYGSDVNFGALTRFMVDYLKKQENFTLQTQTKVSKLNKVKKPSHDNSWHVKLSHTDTKRSNTLNAKFVFIGAGGGALPLLQTAAIDESQGYGGFPVSGQWLICNNPSVVKQHNVKVYGKAAVGAPPMSVPHLDTRIINGKPALLFGPFAGFTTKFLKAGSKLDLAKIKKDNIKPMLGVGRHNLDLTKYLIKEATQTHAQRMDTLRAFLPNANNADWSLAQAGQRAQIIKQCNKEWGKLEFGTEIITTKDKSLAALLGASPGASVSVQAMIAVLEQCFPKQFSDATNADNGWQEKLKQLIPSFGESLIEDAILLGKIRPQTNQTLKLS